MSVEIDYPLPAAIVGATFTVGGTYDTGSEKTAFTITVNMYQSDGINSVLSAPVAVPVPGGTGSWNTSLTVTATLPQNNCILVAGLSLTDTDEVDDINVQANAGGTMSVDNS